MSASEPLLVGRPTEAQVIAEMLDALDADTGRSVLQVAGDPGIGKSRLLRTLCAAAHARGHVVLSGRAAEFEGELPFGVFGDALDDWLASQDPHRLEALAEGSEAELAIVLPAFDRLTPGRPPELQQERYRAYRAVRSLLSALAADAPVVLVLDDMHWADSGSVELVCHLLAHPPRGAVLIALGFRPAQVSPQLGAGLAAALREHEGRRLDLTPLSASAARELLGPDVSDPVADRLYRESGGNPFFLLQLARGVALKRQRPARATELALTVPEPVRAALATELSALSAPSRVLLQGAAVTGDPFDARLAASAAGIGEADALDLLDELLQFHLVLPTAVAGEFAFRHPIVRATVSELTASGWRAHAHARLAALLAARGASALVQAPHVDRSATKGDEGAVTVLVEAGHMSAPRAPALAARWYDSALRLLPEGAEPEARRIELLIAKASALGAAGELEESRATLVELLERLPDGHPARIAVTAFCAGTEHLLGRHRDADARLRRALRLVSDSTSVEAVQLKVELAAGSAYQNRYHDMVNWAEQALEGASDIGDRALAVAAAGQVALASYFLGRPTDAALDRAGAAIDALDDTELASRLDVGLWVGWSEAVLERHERAIEHCQRVIDVSRAAGQGAGLLVTMTAQAWSLIRVGRLAEADELLAGAIEAGRLAPNLFLSVAVGLSSLVATYKGDYAAAVRAGEESVRLARSADPGLIPGMSGLYSAIPLIEMGQAQRAREIVLAMSGGRPELQTSRSGYAAAYEVLTRAELVLGDLDAASDWARRAEEAIHGGELVAEAAFAHRASAAVALARGDAPHAAEMMLEAARRADGAGVPAEAGRCRILAARALVRTGQRQRAVAELERAAEELGHIGADGYRAQAEHELRRLGRRVARRGATAIAAEEGLRSLTDRERELAELVREGHTNREIAAAMYTSEKTIERHLTHIFAKLGVSSRTALALLVAAQSDRNV
ncbi:MAG: AAA family ATPase [Actinomycetota bacterium]|nr:AAA family ATPase [Actinomycetota bacterium]